jgi:hypothetical protein
MDIFIEQLFGSEKKNFNEMCKLDGTIQKERKNWYATVII